MRRQRAGRRRQQSEITERLNERFGTDFTESERLRHGHGARRHVDQ